MISLNFIETLLITVDDRTKEPRKKLGHEESIRYYMRLTTVLPVIKLTNYY